MYTCASGASIKTGRYKLPHAALLDALAAADPDSWIKVSGANRYEDVWPIEDRRPMYLAAPHQPRKIIISLSSFSWDDTRCRLYLFGGGHASTTGNEVYRFDAVSGLWDLAFESTEVQDHFNDAVDLAGQEPVSGSLSGPVSCHTYSTAVYLTHLDRPCWFGGACSPTGQQWQASGPDRTIGPFLLDTTLAGQGYVSTTTGSNVKRGTMAGVDLTGANAWHVRDYKLDHPSPSSHANFARVHDGWAQHTSQGGKDVVYVTSNNSGAASLHMFKITFNHLTDYTLDTIEQIGQSWTGRSKSRMGGGYDSVRNIAITLGEVATFAEADPLVSMWDLDTPGASNHDVVVPMTALTGPSGAEYRARGVAEGNNYGITWDEQRSKFLIWGRGGRVFWLTPPSDKSTTTGWHMEPAGSDSLPVRPLTHAEIDPLPNDDDIGVCGKLHRSATLDAFVVLQGARDGGVWMYKPADWSDPRNA